ncbi:AMP-binding protein, partial [Streptomyces sp. NPDC050698]
MRLTDYLDKGASLGSTAPCLTMGERTLSYGEVQQFSRRFAASLAASGIGPGEKVAILSGNDPISFSCVFGISRAGAVWCPINPRNEAAENRDLLDLFDCRALFFQKSYASLVDQIKDALPQLVTLVCIDGEWESALSLESWLGEQELDVVAPDDVTMLVGTGGTTGRPKGVMLTGHNIETMTAITLMSYPFEGRPVYLALAPLTHAAGVLCFPIMALGGEVVIMPKPDLGYFLANVQKHKVTHTFLPPTLIYMLLEHESLAATDLSSLQCFWYGAAPISPTRLEEAIDKIGPVMAQLFGQSEAPMMISTMSPKEHFGPDGTVATSRLSVRSDNRSTL